MKKYLIRYYGSVGVRHLEFEQSFMRDSYAIDHVERSLPHYHPIYYNAAMWRIDVPDGEEPVLIAEWTSKVTVSRVPRP